MSTKNTLLFAGKFFKTLARRPAFYLLWALYFVLLLYAGFTGHRHMTAQNQLQQRYQQAARESWEGNPAKHPHRMAHFGSFALRLKHPLSLFDMGMENYAGNAVFLEAHRQNTVNFSEAGFSTGLLRMGDLSMAMLLQMIVPLIMFFLGFAAIANDRENGTLKMIFSQGATAWQLLMGRSLGLWLAGSLFFIPAFALCGILLLQHPPAAAPAHTGVRLAALLFCYTVFFWVTAVIAVLISAASRTAKAALLKLLGLWLLLAIILPKTTQVLSQYLYPAPDKLSFETAVEQDILKQGDSHNPDDPFFKNIKDSVLKKYGLTTPDSLPVNLGGIIGREGEKLSAETYATHMARLTGIYRKQNSFSTAFAWMNPFMMIKSNSMALAGTGFEAYVNFQLQAEAYRYALAQRMNDLQIQHISNIKPKEGSHVQHIDKQHWKDFEDFKYRFLPVHTIIHNERTALAALCGWLVFSFAVTGRFAKKFKILM